MKTDSILSLRAKGVILSAVLGGFLFGYDTGVINGCLLVLDRPGTDWDVTDSQKEVIVSSAIWACAVGALISGPVNSIFGRKITLMCGAALLTIASLVMALASSWEILVVGRALDGIAIGFVSMTGPLYIAEQLPSDWRGPATVCYQLMITIGIFMGGIIAGLFEPVTAGWRWMLGLSCLPSTVMFVLFIFMPKSVRWLYFKGEAVAARETLTQLRATGAEVDLEMEAIKDDYTRVQEDKELGGSGFTVLVNMFRNVAVRRALLLGVALQLFQQLSGINSVMYYSSTILEMAGTSTKMAIWLSCIVSTANVAFTFIGLYGVERAGRKILLLGSMLVMVLGLSLLGFSFVIMDLSKKSLPVTFSDAGCPVPDGEWASCYTCLQLKDCGICEDSAGEIHCIGSADNNPLLESVCGAGADLRSECKASESWLAVMGLTLYIMGFAPGMGPLPWTINSEIFPNWARDTALCITTFTNWLGNSIISQTFLTLSKAAGRPGAFFTYAAVALLGMVYFFIFLPETKGISLERTDELFRSRKTFIGFKPNTHGKEREEQKE